MEKSVKIQKISALCGAAVLIAAFVALYCTFGRELTKFVGDTEGFKAWLDGYKGIGAVIFVGIRALQTVIKIIPAEPLEIAAGYVYGTFGGLALCMLGTLIGSVAILLLTRSFGTRVLDLFVPKSKLESFSFLKDENRCERLLFMIYLIPSTPKDIITYLVGCTKIKPVRFLLITSIARIPSIITSTLCGAQLGQNNLKLAIVIFAATAAVGALGSVLYGIYDKKHHRTVTQSTPLVPAA